MGSNKSVLLMWTSSLATNCARL